MPRPKSTVRLRHVVVNEWLRQPKGAKNLSSIARHLGTSRLFVRTWVNRFLDTGDVADKGKTGRPRKLSKADDTTLARLMQTKACDTAAEAREHMPSKVCTNTVRRALKRENYVYKPPRSVLHLTLGQKQKRLKFARRWRNGGPWKRTVYTDSSYFILGGPARKCGKHRYVLHDELNEHVEFKNPLKIHVYGGISVTGRTRLAFVTGTTGQHVPQGYKGKGCGAQEYRGVLQTTLVPDSRALFSDGGEWWFLQDWAPGHKAKLTQQYLDQNCPKWFSDWPGNSPDLNPIEHVWKAMKDQLRGKAFASIDEFKAEVTRVWTTYPQRNINSLINSMWRRIRAVQSENGGRTKY